MQASFDWAQSDQRLCMDLRAEDCIFHVGLQIVLGFEALFNQLGRTLENKDSIQCP